MSQRAALRLVYWVVLGCVLLLSAAEPGATGVSRPGFFRIYHSDPLMLLIGGAIVAALVVIGLRI
jgi:hypothetical protein